MNKKEVFVDALCKKTELGTMKWKAVPLKSLDDRMVYDSYSVLRLYKAETSERELFVIEKKLPRYDFNTERYFDASIVEVLILSDKGLELLINDTVVSRDLLYKLLLAVADRANDLDRFFEEFSKDI